MSWLNRLIRTIHPGKLEGDLDEELRFHLEMRIEEYVRSGMSLRGARRQAVMRFGNQTYVKERTREMDILVWIESIWQDICYSLRIMRRSPALSAAVVLALVLGIGANTAIFSIADAALLRSLPLNKPGEIVLLNWDAPKMPGRCLFVGNLDDSEGGGTTGWSFSMRSFEQLRRSNSPIASVAAFQKIHSDSTIFARGRAEIAAGILISGDFFQTLGLLPHAGRLLDPTDDKSGAAPAVVLGYPFWNRMFGGDLSVVGEVVRINGNTFTVVGVTPASFFGLSPGEWPDFFLPLIAQPLVFPMGSEGPAASNERLWWLQLVARKKSSLDSRAAQALWNASFQQSLASLRIEKPEERPVLQIEPGSRGYSFVRQDLADPLWILMALAGLVLLITCADVANLLLARATSRTREAAMRSALGAGRPRLIRQHLTESMLLALLGGGGGMLVGIWCADALLALANNKSDPLIISLRFDWRFFSFALALTIATGLLFGLAPARRAARTDLSAALQDSGRAVARGWARRFGSGRLLVASQIAVSVVVVITAGLFLHSLNNLNAIPLGFRAESLLLFNVNPLSAGYSQAEKSQLLTRIAARLRAISSVRSVTWSRYALVGNSAAMSRIRIPGQFDKAGKSEPCYMLPIGPGFHETMGIPILLGRMLDEHDDATAPKRAVVNDSFIKKYLSGIHPIGRQFLMTDRNQDTPVEIVGVAGDARYDELRGPVPPTAYLPDVQQPSRSAGAVFELRTAGRPEAVIAAIRDAVREVDPYLPVFNIRTQLGQINEHLRQERLVSFLAGGFAALAMLLAGIGLYGVTAYGVSRRTSEIGVRMALGATRQSIRRLILRDSAFTAIPGTIIGLGLAVTATRVIQSYLYGLDPADPLTLATATAALLAVAALASLLPAQRASRVNPLAALRHE